MKVLLFKHHANDPLSFAISALTRSGYVHAALLVEEDSHTIVEAFFPEVRRRQLNPVELPGIDVFAVSGITPTQESAVLAYAQQAIGGKEKYSIGNLFRFVPTIRAVIGEGDNDSINAPAFCSQFVFKALKYGAGIALLNAHSQDVDPGHLAWSPLLIPQSPLTALPIQTKVAA